MNVTTHQYIAAKNCPYTVEGTNLVELRRAKLRKIAEAVKVSPEGSKNDILHRLITKLRAMGSEKELTENG